MRFEVIAFKLLSKYWFEQIGRKSSFKSRLQKKIILKDNERKKTIVARNPFFRCPQPAIITNSGGKYWWLRYNWFRKCQALAVFSSRLKIPAPQGDPTAHLKINGDAVKFWIVYIKTIPGWVKILEYFCRWINIFAAPDTFMAIRKENVILECDIRT